MLLKFLWVYLQVTSIGKESGTVLLIPPFHMCNLYADSNDCTNSSQNILAVYMIQRIVLTKNLLIQQKGRYWFKTRVFMQCFYHVCQSHHISSANACPQSYQSSLLQWFRAGWVWGSVGNKEGLFCGRLLSLWLSHGTPSRAVCLSLLCRRSL